MGADRGIAKELLLAAIFGFLGMSQGALAMDVPPDFENPIKLPGQHCRIVTQDGEALNVLRDSFQNVKKFFHYEFECEEPERTRHRESITRVLSHGGTILLVIRYEQDWRFNPLFRKMLPYHIRKTETATYDGFKVSAAGESYRVYGSGSNDYAIRPTLGFMNPRRKDDFLPSIMFGAAHSTRNVQTKSSGAAPDETIVDESSIILRQKFEPTHSGEDFISQFGQEVGKSMPSVLEVGNWHDGFLLPKPQYVQYEAFARKAQIKRQSFVSDHFWGNVWHRRGSFVTPVALDWLGVSTVESNQGGDMFIFGGDENRNLAKYESFGRETGKETITYKKIQTAPQHRTLDEKAFSVRDCANPYHKRLRDLVHQKFKLIVEKFQETNEDNPSYGLGKMVGINVGQQRPVIAQCGR